MPARSVFFFFIFGVVGTDHSDRHHVGYTATTMPVFLFWNLVNKEVFSESSTPPSLLGHIVLFHQCFFFSSLYTRAEMSAGSRLVPARKHLLVETVASVIFAEMSVPVPALDKKLPISTNNAFNEVCLGRCLVSLVCLVLRLVAQPSSVQ